MGSFTYRNEARLVVSLIGIVGGPIAVSSGSDAMQLQRTIIDANSTVTAPSFSAGVFRSSEAPVVKIVVSGWLMAQW